MLIIFLIAIQAQTLVAFEAHIINVTAEIQDGIADHLVINKVYYDVDCGHGSEIYNEWVEIYNPTDESIDITGWTITDNISSSTIPVSNPVPAWGYAIITSEHSTWTKWHIPSGVVKITIGASIGNGLDNDADMLMLIDGGGNIVDQMNWGVPDTGWVNYNSDIWNPGAIDVAEGGILSRNPNGYDTDRASDWQEFDLPNVTVVVPNGGEIWSIGATSTIEWLAVNNNGRNSDLSIDIYYSADSGVSWATVVKGIANTGFYNWRVPLYIGDYSIASSRARIKIAATDYTKNFMITAWDISDNDFCPPIDYDLLTAEELAILEQMGMLNESDNNSAVDNNASSTAKTASSTDEILNDDFNNSDASSTDAIASSTITIFGDDNNATSTAGIASSTVDSATSTAGIASSTAEMFNVDSRNASSTDAIASSTDDLIASTTNKTVSSADDANNNNEATQDSKEPEPAIDPTDNPADKPDGGGSDDTGDDAGPDPDDGTNPDSENKSETEYQQESSQLLDQGTDAESEPSVESQSTDGAGEVISGEVNADDLPLNVEVEVYTAA